MNRLRRLLYKNEAFTIFVDWFLRLIKYSLLVCATFSLQHMLLVVAAVCVIISSFCDLVAQIILVRREID
jgi:hypothetical protein